MDKEAIIEYHEIMNSLKITIDAMKWIQYKQDNYDFDVIIAISEKILQNIRRFCVNYVGDIEDM